MNERNDRDREGDKQRSKVKQKTGIRRTIVKKEHTTTLFNSRRSTLKAVTYIWHYMDSAGFVYIFRNTQTDRQTHHHHNNSN